MFCCPATDLRWSNCCPSPRRWLAWAPVCSLQTSSVGVASAQLMCGWLQTGGRSGRIPFPQAFHASFYNCFLAEGGSHSALQPGEDADTANSLPFVALWICCQMAGVGEAQHPACGGNDSTEALKGCCRSQGGILGTVDIYEAMVLGK